MNQPFTASGVRETAIAIGLIDMPDTARMLRAYADRLEADEKAVPVVWCDPATINAAHPTCYKKLEYTSIADSVAGVKFISLYTHPAPADAERLAEALRDLVSRACMEAERFGEGREDKVNRIIAEWRTSHSAQAQPPAASMTKDSIERACRAWCADQGWDADAPVTYAGTRKQVLNRDGSVVKQWEMHIPEATVILESALLAAQEDPNG